MTTFRQGQREMFFGFTPIPSRQMSLALHPIQVAFAVPFLRIRRRPSGEADAETENSSNTDHSLSLSVREAADFMETTLGCVEYAEVV